MSRRKFHFYPDRKYPSARHEEVTASTGDPVAFVIAEAQARAVAGALVLRRCVVDSPTFVAFGAPGTTNAAVLTPTGPVVIEDGGPLIDHLYDNQGHDESSVWCGADSYYRTFGDPTPLPEQANCIPCLLATAKFGEAAKRRLRELGVAP